MILVKVPATSANIAVGYDCLGLAIDNYAKFKFQECSNQLQISGCPSKYRNSNNLVYQSFKFGCHYLHKKIPNLKIIINSQVPIARGLGSSATCIVSGLTASFLWFHHSINSDIIFQLATKIEGHPDNVAPAIYGGLCASFYNQARHQYQTINYPVSNQFYWATISPNYQISTNSARQILPKALSYPDVTYQISHCLLLIHALKTGHLKQLKEALKDKMQEPYRKKLIKHHSLITSIVHKFHGTIYISGSGSTMMIINKNHELLNDCLNIIKKDYPKYRIRFAKVNNNGTKYSETV